MDDIASDALARFIRDFKLRVWRRTNSRANITELQKQKKNKGENIPD